ncbi:MAG: BadF/BadG/BcrA/BcrD ATPase family protein [Massiliimalia sp.]|jgi:N-acetylglucosamine kinase-like BadF-type ATPase
MKYYLGIDQGGTKTEVAVCNEKGEILGFGSDAGLKCQYFRDDQEIYLKHIKTACKAALNEANLDFCDINTVCASLNGADWGFEYAPLAFRLIKLLHCMDIILINDCIGAMRGGSLEENCAVICAGTGTNIAVCREDRENLIYGYFVPPVIQGGSALGQQMFDAVLEEYIGIGSPTCLTEMVLKHTGYHSIKELFMDITLGKYNLSYRYLVQDFLKACVDGDSVAKNIALQFAKKTAQFICAGIKKQEMENMPLDLVYSGSVFKDNGVYITNLISQIVHQHYPQIHCIDANFEPVCGCLLEIFRREYSAHIPDHILESLQCTAKSYHLLRDVLIRV